MYDVHMTCQFTSLILSTPYLIKFDWILRLWTTATAASCYMY